MKYLPILNYHGIQSFEGEYAWAAAETPYVISRQTFSRQLQVLSSRKCLALDTHRLQAWIEGRGPAQDCAMFTFDDGHQSHFDHAAPLLLERKFPAIFFISAGLVGKTGQMGWRELGELVKAGFEIGSHGMSHTPLMGLPADSLHREIKSSKDKLEDVLGVSVKSFSVPRGFYHPQISRSAGESGYQFLFSSNFDFNRRGQDLLCMNRIALRTWDSESYFMGLLEGHLGLKKYKEQMKSLARSVVPPKIYDTFASMKRGLR